jgi:hypothetical protein
LIAVAATIQSAVTWTGNTGTIAVSGNTFTDDFESYADGALESVSSWTMVAGSLATLTGDVYLDVLSQDSYAVAPVTCATQTQFAESTVTLQGALRYGGVTVRGADDSISCYWLRWRSGLLQLARMSGGSFTQLGQTNVGIGVAPDTATLRLEAQADGTGGVDLRGYYDGVLKFDINSTVNVQTGTKVGMLHFSSSGLTSPTLQEDFDGGDITGSGSFIPGAVTWTGNTGTLNVTATSGSFIGAGATPQTWTGSTGTINVTAQSAGLIPQNLTEVSATGSEVVISWDGVWGAQSYDIDRDSTVIATAFAGTQYTDNTVSPTTSYDYRVRARFT